MEATESTSQSLGSRRYLHLTTSSGRESAGEEFDEEGDDDEGQEYSDSDRSDGAHAQDPMLTVRSMAP